MDEKENPNNSQTEKPQNPKIQLSLKQTLVSYVFEKEKHPFIIYSLTMSGGPVPVWKKYTTRPQGIWEKIRQLLVLVPNRSSGNPLVSLFRQVPPGERIKEAQNYKDPVTIPAGDIKGNPYFKRDYRRNYPQVHTFNQTKISGLLNLGSESNPRISIERREIKNWQCLQTDKTLV